MTKAPDSPKGTGDVEITPEMIEAGVGAYCGFDERFESLQEMIGRVYCAMALMTTGNARAGEGRRRISQ